MTAAEDKNPNAIGDRRAALASRDRVLLTNVISVKAMSVIPDSLGQLLRRRTP